jgi:molybdate transport system substrate-binding protein
LRRSRIAGVVLAAVLLWAAAPVRAEEIRVLTSGAFAAALGELGPQFQRAANIDVVVAEGGTLGSGPDTIPSRLARGEPVDVLIMSATALDDLVRAGKVEQGSRVDLGKSGIGMAVRVGTPHPDITTVDALRQTLLRAKSIAFSSSISGVYLSTELFQKLGIADQVLPRSKRIEVGRVGAAVARGEAEIGFQQKSELVTVPGIEYVGPLPEAVQRTTVFAAGIVRGAVNAAGAKRLIEFLAGPAARAAILRSGLDPVR